MNELHLNEIYAASSEDKSYWSVETEYKGEPLERAEDDILVQTTLRDTDSAPVVPGTDADTDADTDTETAPDTDAPDTDAPDTEAADAEIPDTGFAGRQMILRIDCPKSHPQHDGLMLGALNFIQNVLPLYSDNLPLGVPVTFPLAPVDPSTGLPANLPTSLNPGPVNMAASPSADSLPLHGPLNGPFMYPVNSQCLAPINPHSTAPVNALTGVPLTPVGVEKPVNDSQPFNVDYDGFVDRAKAGPGLIPCGHMKISKRKAKPKPKKPVGRSDVAAHLEEVEAARCLMHFSRNPDGSM